MRCWTWLSRGSTAHIGKGHSCRPLDEITLCALLGTAASAVALKLPDNFVQSTSPTTLISMAYRTSFLWPCVPFGIAFYLVYRKLQQQL